MKKDQRQARPRATKTIDPVPPPPPATATMAAGFEAAIAASLIKVPPLRYRPRTRDGGDLFSTKPAAPPRGPDNDKMIEWARDRRRERGLADLNRGST